MATHHRLAHVVNIGQFVNSSLPKHFEGAPGRDQAAPECPGLPLWILKRLELVSTLTTEEVLTTGVGEATPNDRDMDDRVGGLVSDGRFGAMGDPASIVEFIPKLLQQENVHPISVIPLWAGDSEAIPKLCHVCGVHVYSEPRQVVLDELNKVQRCRARQILRGDFLEDDLPKPFEGGGRNGRAEVSAGSLEIPRARRGADSRRAKIQPDQFAVVVYSETGSAIHYIPELVP